ncbi:hypothetical protein [Clostridium sp. Marseille-P299]|uniref:hypothetical protein n=1 Tax=Clostridium sp. Marseille-P299 TaxID=1805477 RepID=UPI00325A4610
MAMFTVNNFEGHRSSAINGIHVSTGRAKAALATEGKKLKFLTVGQPYMAPP